MTDFNFFGPFELNDAGEFFNDVKVFNFTNSPIKEIVVHTGTLGESMRTIFADGMSTLKHGGEGGEHSLFKLEDNEYVTYFTVRTGSSVDYFKLLIYVGNAFEAGGSSDDPTVTILTEIYAGMDFLAMSGNARSCHGIAVERRSLKRT